MGKQDYLVWLVKKHEAKEMRFKKLDDLKNKPSQQDYNLNTGLLFVDIEISVSFIKQMFFK